MTGTGTGEAVITFEASTLAPKGSLGLMISMPPLHQCRYLSSTKNIHQRHPRLASVATVTRATR